MHSPLRLLIVLLALPLPYVLAGADSIAARLDATEQQALKAGETVVRVEELPGKAWPRLQLFRLVDASPQVVLDLFSDYASAPSYTPGMIAAEVVAEPETHVKDVRYTVRVPVLSRISYTVRNRYSRQGQIDKIAWQLLESPLASESTGSLEIEPFGKGRTLLCYTNHVTPKVPLAGALRGHALKEATTTIEAIEKEAARRAAEKR